MGPRVAVMPHEDVLAWLKQHQMTLRGLAKLIDREPSFVSKVIRGRAQSNPIWREIRTVMQNPKNPLPALRRQRRRDAAALERARVALRRAGLLA